MHWGEGYFRELWLLGLQYAVYWLNRTSRGGRDSPFNKVWGKEYEMHVNDHVFGSFCMYRISVCIELRIQRGGIRGTLSHDQGCGWGGTLS